MEYLLRPGDRVERVADLGAAPSIWHDISALFQLWLLIRKYRPDIVHTHTAKAGFLGRAAAWLARCPSVVHTYHGHVLEGYFTPRVNRLVRFAERSLARLSQALLTVSGQQAEELSHRFAIAPNRKFHVVPLGLDLEPYRRVPPADFSARELQVVWLGRFVPIKNLDLMIDVAAAAQRRQLPLRFTLAGEGPLKRQFQDAARAKKLRNLRFLDWQENVESLLAESHLLIMTSHREGTPLALIQGMAAGRPFVSTPAGGTVDLGSGVPQLETQSWWYKNAVLASADAEAFAGVLERLNDRRDLLDSMAGHARDFATARFSESRLASDVAALYSSLLPVPARQQVRS